MFNVQMFEMDWRIIDAATSEGKTLDRHAHQVSSRVLLRKVVPLHSWPKEDELLVAGYLLTVTGVGFRNPERSTKRLFDQLSHRSRVHLYRVCNWGIGIAGPDSVPTINPNGAYKNTRELGFQKAVNDTVIETLTALRERLYAYDHTVVWKSRLYTSRPTPSSL